MLNQVLVGMGRRELMLEEVRRMIGDGTPAMMERALVATGGITDLNRAHRELMQIYEASPPNLSRLYPGVEITLRLLRDSSANLGICTNKPQAATRTVLEAFHIAHYFEAVVGGDMVPFRKPFSCWITPSRRLRPDIWLDDFAAIPETLARLVSSDRATTRSTDAPGPGQ